MHTKMHVYTSHRTDGRAAGAIRDSQGVWGWYHAKVVTPCHNVEVRPIMPPFRRIGQRLIRALRAHLAVSFYITSPSLPAWLRAGFLTVGEP